jgi:hypothetical protein
VIQGLEEVLVKSASDVIAILQKGSKKRQTAGELYEINLKRPK